MNLFPDVGKKAVWTFFLLLPSLCLAAPLPTPFEASYGFYRNGKLAGETTFSFDVEHQRWTLTTASTGTRGLAKFLGLEERSSSSGSWSENGPVPFEFEQHINVAIKTIKTSARFDWENAEVVSRFDDSELTLPLEPGILDPVSEGLAIRADLSEGKTQWQFQVLDEDEFESHRFQAGAEETIETAIGCMTVVTVSRIRHEGSTRYTRTQYARDLHWVPVRLEHGKTDGDQMESRIEKLMIDGQAVPAGPACS